MSSDIAHTVHTGVIITNCVDSNTAANLAELSEQVLYMISFELAVWAASSTPNIRNL